MKECPGVAMPCGENCMNPAYGFVMIQEPMRIYDYASGLTCGTIFPDLVFPKGKYGPKENFMP